MSSPEVGVTVREAAELLTCHRVYVHLLVSRGKLRVVGSVPARCPGGRKLLVDYAGVLRLRAAGCGLDVPSRRGPKPKTNPKGGAS